MAIKNNVTEYETPLRENFELTASATALLGALGYEAYAQFGDFPAGPVHWIAGGFALYGLNRAIPAAKLLKRHLHLAGTPIPCHTFEDLRNIFARPDHQGEMWLGKGFAWGPPHTQLAVDILKTDWPKLSKDALGPIYKWRFIKKNLGLCIKHPFEAHRCYVEREKSLQSKGLPWIHGLGNGEEDIFQPLSHSEGHTLIIGTTGSGKTRCFDLLISQAILRGETVIIIDPKGDHDLRDKALRACKELGREHAFVHFHPAHPEESVKLNLLANWTRPTEIASRVSNLIPSQGPSDPFKNFAWGALNTISQGLCIAYQKPSLMNLRRYLEGSPEEMMETSFTQYLLKMHGQKDGQRMIDDAFEQMKKDTLSNRVNALVELYQEYGPKSPEIDGLISLRDHDQEHFGKMITSVLPILQMLTSGELGKLLSPPEDPDEAMLANFRDTGDFIEKNCVVYLGLDSLSDGMVGAAIGSLMLADLTAAGGARYNFAHSPRAVNIFVDEAAEVVNESFIQLLNKGRGARFKLFVATQTIADFAARLGSKDKCTQVLGNLNNTISLRCIDLETQKFVAERFPKTKVKSVAVDQGLSTDADEGIPTGGRIGEKLTETESPLFPPELLGMLPDLEFIANLSGGKVIKGRYPLIVKDMSEFKPG